MRARISHNNILCRAFWKQKGFPGLNSLKPFVVGSFPCITDVEPVLGGFTGNLRPEARFAGRGALLSWSLEFL